MKNKLWGFIDKTGKQITPIHFLWVEDFKEGKAKVQLNGKEFHIDKTGKEVK